MDLERQRKGQRLLAELFDIPPHERLERLERSCDGDAELREHVHSLLIAAADASDFLDTPAIACAREPLRSAEHALIGRTLGNYELLEPLGRGGMGVVYRARQRSPERDVAVKVTPGAFSASTLRRFEAESRALARMQHPGIATVLEAGVDVATGAAWIAMEYVIRGRPLTLYAHEERLDRSARLALFRAACEAIHHGHVKGVIHRDVKPSNVLVGADGRVKVIDFGIARLLNSDEAQATRTSNAPVGTLPYMSPEQCANELADVRSDVYSLGVVLHELIAGSAPISVDAMSLESALRAIRAQSPVPLRRVVPDVERDLETIVLTALEKDPKRRYQSVAALMDDLDRFRDHRPIEARPASWAHHAALFTRRHRALVTAAIAVGVSMSVATIVSVKFALDAKNELVEREKAQSQAQAERDAAIRHSYIATMASASAALADGEIHRLQQVLQDAPAGLRGWEWHYLHRQSQSAESIFELHQSRLFCAAWHPHQNVIASGDLRGQVRFWRSDGTPLGEIRSTTHAVLSLAWSPDGELLAVGSLGQPIALYRIQASSDAWRAELLPSSFPLIGAALNALQFSPDGTRLGYAGERGVRVWQVADARELITIPCRGAARGFAFGPHGTHFAFANEASLAIHSTADGSLLRTISDGSNYISTHGWSPDGRDVAIAYEDGRVTFWDAIDGSRRGEIRCGVRAIRCVAYGPDGAAILVAGDDPVMRLVDRRQLEVQRVLAGHFDIVSSVHFNASGTHVVSASADRTARIWDLRDDDGSTMQLGERWRPPVGALTYSPDSTRLLVGNERGLLLLLDAHSWQTVARHDVPGEGRSAAAFSPDGASVAVATGPTKILIMDAELGRTLLTLDSASLPSSARAISRRAGALAFSPDGQFLAAGCADHAVRMWHVTGPNAGTCVMNAEGNGSHGGDVTAVVFTPDGATLYTASIDRSIARWDRAAGTTSWSRTWSRTNHDDSILCLALHPSGSTLVSGGRDQHIVLTDPVDGTIRERLEGHGQVPDRILFTRDGSRMFSSSRFLDVKVWEWSSRSELLTLRDPALATIRSMALRPDERELVAGGNGVVTRWSIDRLRHLRVEHPRGSSP